jgi:hypothetical protein
MPTKMPDRPRSSGEWRRLLLTLLIVLSVFMALGAFWYGSGAFFDWVSRRQETASEHEDRL